MFKHKTLLTTIMTITQGIKINKNVIFRQALFLLPSTFSFGFVLSLLLDISGNASENSTRNFIAIQKNRLTKKKLNDSNTQIKLNKSMKQ